MADDREDTIQGKLLGETAKVDWAEIERLFASGKVIRVASDLDLIEVGEAMSLDQAERVKDWMRADQLGWLDDDTAARWASHPECELWGLVISPWVLVQERLI